MSDKQAAKQRMEVLKGLRKEHHETVERTQASLKEQQAFRKQLRQAMADEALTIPQIAAATRLPSDQILWHVIAMKEYGLIEEVGKDESYYQYKLVQESSQ